MLASVAICTYNRSDYLRKTLSALNSIELDNDDDFEIIIVDNNSVDDTRSIAVEFIKTSNLPSKYIFEEKQGLSYARNSAINSSDAEVLAFLDDDAIPQKDWLKELLRVYKEYPAACVGGRINLAWEAPQPLWFSDKLYYFLSYLNYGDTTVELTSRKDVPFGANISFTKNILEVVGGFNPALGRKGALLFDAEEVELCHRIRTSGGKIWYTPKAMVCHAVPISRMQKKYFLDSAYWKGRSAVRTSMFRDGRLKTVLRAGKRGGKLFLDSFRKFLYGMFNQSAHEFYFQVEQKIDIGFIHEFFYGSVKK
jgi:glycosyltransferase involved in cell wall biosynthesis